MNSNKIIENLVPNDSKEIEGVHFDMKRYVEDKVIYKDITVSDGSETFKFQEKVRALTLNDFEELLHKYGLRIDDIFGNYNLEPFDHISSKRLIIKAKK